MAENGNSSHLSTGGKKGELSEKRGPGPVPMRHLLRLGKDAHEVQRNPFGDKAPSKTPTTKGGW
jgi:hypothetical protein